MDKYNIIKNIVIVITSFFVILLIYALAISIGYYALIITGVADKYPHIGQHPIIYGWLTANVIERVITTIIAARKE